MAKITDYPQMTTPDGSEELLGVQGGKVKSATVKQITDAATAAATVPVDALAAKVDTIAVSQNSGLIAYATKADMDADLSKPDGALAQVTNDATTANNQSYRKSGAAGTGSWVASVDRLANALGNGSGFQQAGTGSVLRTVQDKLRETVSVLDYGAVGDGIADDTAGIQKALNTSLHVVFPGRQYRINAAGLTLHTGQTVEFRGGASIKLLPHNTTTYQMLRVWDIQNVTIINANLDGSRELNGATTGEWGMAVDIRGATNVLIKGIQSTGCWGDGIYIAGSGTGGQGYCLKVRVESHSSYNDRRNGMSIVSGRSIKVTNPIWDTPNGTAPQSGLDIEPNTNNDILEDIVIDNPTTRNCAGYAIAASLQNLAGDRVTGGSIPKTLSITINNHTDYGSFAGGGTYGCMAANTGVVVAPVNGSVTWNNPKWVQSQKCAYGHQAWGSAGPVVRLVNPTVVDCNTTADSNDQYNCAFSSFRLVATGNQSCGNLIVIGADVTIANTTIKNLFYARDVGQAQNMINCRFIDPVNLAGTAATAPSVIRATGGFFDRNMLNVIAMTASASFDYTTVAGRYLSPATAATATMGTNVSAGQTDFVFQVSTNGQALTISPGGTGRLGNGSTGVGLSSSVAGDYIRIRCTSSGTWQIVERVGTWA